MISLTGEQLEPVTLRFNYSSASAQDSSPRQGLRKYGPYDYNIFDKDPIRVGIIFSKQLVGEKDTLKNGLINGNGSFGGFRQLFRVSLSITREVSFSKEDCGEIRRVIRNLVSQDNIDLALVLTSFQNEAMYRVIKQELLGNGIPNQIVTASRLRNPSQVPWILENIALACYAKSGGTPWVAASEHNRRELVIGISRAQTREQGNQFVVGFVTLFTQDGDFLFLHSSAPVLGWQQEEYVNGLKQLIISAYEEYCQYQGPPESLVLHLCKRPGRYREIQAVEQAMREIDVDIPFALVHLNDDSNYRLFDSGHSTFVPASGLKVDLSRRESLLLLDGRINDRRNRKGVPRVLDIVLDKRSSMSHDEFPHLVRQVYNFAWLNWRGFNAYAVPVTLNYSYLIARLIVEIGAGAWNQIISNGRLRDKAWFL